MKDIILLCYLASILFSAIMAFTYRAGLKSNGIFILLPYLFFVFIQELGVFFYLRSTTTPSTGIIYNFYRPITVMIFSFIYFNIPFRRPFKKIIIALLCVYFGFILITFSFFQSIFSISNYAGTAAGLVLTSLGIFFLFFYFDLDNKKEETKWKPLFLISLALVVFYPVINISNAFHNHLLAYDVKIAGIKLYKLVPQLMSIFMYCCFARAFYLCRKKS